MKFFVYFATFILRPTFFTAREIRSLIIDTDAGSDDAGAILNILGAEELFHEVKVELITTARGNTHVDNVGRNVLKILKTADRLNIPVHKGANESLLVTPKTDDYFGEDGFGDFPFPNPPSEDLIQKQHAVNALVTAVSLNPGKYSLVCLAPLTNIALAIKLYPKFLTQLKEIYVLGGSDSGIGNIQPGVEFNIYVDPESTFIVFNSAKENNVTLNLITWETAYKRSFVDMNWRENVLGVIESPQVDLLNKAERKIIKSSKWTSADTFASAVVLDNSIVESSDKYSADIEVCGSLSRGVVLIDYENSKMEFSNIKLIRKINIDKFKQMLLQNLNPRGGSASGATKIL